MHSALEGIRVLDWTLGQQGPVATALLGELGADVIKIESHQGDLGRDLIPGRVSLPGNRTYYYEANNRNKRGIVLDFKKPEGKEILYGLVEKSDVFVQNFRKGVAERLGADYHTLSRYNPKLIYASANAFGPEGPDSEKPGIDLTALARSGIMLAIGHPDWAPVYPRAMADQIGAIMMAWSILAALVARERLGVGQEVDTSLLGSLVLLQGLNFSSYLIQGEEFGRQDRKDAKAALSNWYRCADGQWLVLAMTRDTRYWHDFCLLMGIGELENDPRFDTNEKRKQNKRELISVLEAVFATKPRAEWIERLSQKEDMMFSPVCTIPETAADPQVLLNKYLVDFDHPVLGKIKHVGLPVKFSKTPASITREAPELGQHTGEILGELLGYSTDKIKKLKDTQVI